MDDPAAHVEDRAPRGARSLDGLQHELRDAAPRRTVSGKGDALWIDEGHHIGRDVLWNVDDDRAGSPRTRDVEGLLDDLREVAHVLDEVVVLRARSRNADRIDFLERVAPEHLSWD